MWKVWHFQGKSWHSLPAFILIGRLLKSLGDEAETVSNDGEVASQGYGGKGASCQRAYSAYSVDILANASSSNINN